MLRLSPDILSTLIRRSVEGASDPFGLLALAEEHGFESENQAYFDAADDLVSEILDSGDYGFRINFAPLLERRPTQLLDRISAELLAYAGCDPAATCAIAIFIDDSVVVEDDTGGHSLIIYLDESNPPDSGSCLSSVRITPGIDYRAGSLCVEIPEIVRTAAVGRPLCDIISHPVLDRRPLTVTGVGENLGRPVLITDADRTPLQMGEILAIRPLFFQDEGQQSHIRSSKVRT